MSKIFEALKRVQFALIDGKDSPANGTETSRQPERRRTCRIRVQAPLFVYGYKGDNPFHEEACTVEINAHGGLISMQTEVRPGQKLLVMNKEDESSQQCVVLSVRVRQECAFDVGFEFPTAIPQFWQNLEMVPKAVSDYVNTQPGLGKRQTLCITPFGVTLKGVWETAPRTQNNDSSCCNR